MKGGYARNREVRMTVKEEESVSEVFKLFKIAVTTLAAEVVWYKYLTLP